jgi:hypothetical protein
VSATASVGAFVGGVRNGKAFQVTMPGGDSHSFECAIHALAPTCEYCGVKVIGHGVGGRRLVLLLRLLRGHGLRRRGRRPGLKLDRPIQLSSGQKPYTKAALGGFSDLHTEGLRSPRFRPPPMRATRFARTN